MLSSITPSTFGQNFLTLNFLAKFPSITSINNAIIRNKIKRRLRNIMNDALKKININNKYSYLFMAKKNVFDDEYILIKKNIFETLEKVE